MRAIGMLSLAGLILTGLPPAPIAPVSGAAQRAERTASSDDPDARCAPFFTGFNRDEDSGYGRGASLQRVPGAPMNGIVSAPPPPPPPPPPSPSPSPMTAQDQAAQGRIAVTGTRVAPNYMAPQENRERYA